MAEINIPGYQITDRLSDSTRALVLRGQSLNDGGSVIIKTTNDDRPRRAEVERHQHEYVILNHLVASQYVARALGFQIIEGRPVLVMEDRGGLVLEQVIEDLPDIEQALQYSIAIATALADIHDHKVIHKDIKPRNILIDASGFNAQIIDFCIASLLQVEHQEAPPPALIEGTLPYISPEQTGRMNRGVDYRSDLYSLGITIYRTLTGQLPFHGIDPLEWCHCHLAKEPTPPGDMRNDVPPVLSEIVLKLMAKVPEERYQSARGLAHDLQRCLDDLRANGTISAFPLGEQDHGQGFQIPEKLYGRDQETSTLLNHFNEMVDDGRCRLVLVAGYSGIGKSSLVHELHRPIVETRGTFLFGKFDQYKRDIPYATIAQVLQGLMRQILSESEDVIATWRQRISEAVGVNGRVITDVIPEVELIIGAQPPVPELGPSESQNRFNMVFRDFSRVLARREAPIAIFLDDMQWADNATLHLLENLFADVSIRYICFILAYRDNEVDAAHPFVLALENLEKQGVEPLRINLKPLDEHSLCALVGDTMHAPHDDHEVRSLSRIITEKTDGNPFFVIQFLKRLHEEEMLHFDSDARRFRCDLEQVGRRGYTDNVVEHMIGRIQMLPADTRDVLSAAACAGNTFELDAMCMAKSLAPAAAARCIWPAIESGLVAPIGDAYKRAANLPDDIAEIPPIAYRFQHDRIQQAAYSLFTQDQRMAAHLRLGRGWRDKFRGPALDDHIFAIVSQLNPCVELIDDEAERIDLADLNLRAGRKAKGSTAYGTAVRHLTHAAELLPANAWESHYELAFPIHVELAECRYLNGDFEIAETLFKQVVAVAHDIQEAANIYILRSRLYQVSGDYEGASDLCEEALALLDIRVPPTEGELNREIEAAIAESKRNLRGREIRDLASSPRITDHKIRAIIDVAVSAIPCVYIGRPAYFPWYALLAFNTTLQYGNTESSCFAYSSYAFFLVESQPRDSYEFSRLALDLNERFQDKALRGTLLHLHGDHFNYWSQPIASNFSYLERAFVACQEVGDLVYSGFVAFEIIWQFIERGDTLSQVLSQSERYETFAKQTNNSPVLNTIQMQQKYVACLQGRTRSLVCMSDNSFDEDACLQSVMDAGFGCGTVFFHIMKQILYFHSGRYAESLESAIQAKPVLGAASAMPILATHYFYHALTLCALYPEVDASTQAAYLREIEGFKRIWKIWADSCPENFANRYHLLRAETARIKGLSLLAMQLYEQAARESRESGFPHYEALINELAGRYCLARGLSMSAESYLSEARRGYSQWGAEGLAARLIRDFPGLHSHSRVRGDLSFATTAPGLTSTALSTNLDIATVVKVTQAISRELQFTSLVQNLLTTAIESAGADRGCLLLRDENGKITIFQSDGTSRQFDQADDLARSVVSFVLRTGKRLLLDDASKDDTYRSDPHIIRSGVRSLLCLPIVRRGELMSMLYLENRLLTRVFTPSRIAMLDVIATQSAISLQNAELYDEMEQRVLARTQELREAQKKLVTTAHQAGMAEIASSILHNIGNVLTSVNTNVSLMSDALDEMQLSLLQQTAQLIDDHRDDLAAFLNTDERGKQLPELLRLLFDHLDQEKDSLGVKLSKIKNHLNHIQSVVTMQQKYAGFTQRLTEECLARELVEDAFKICDATLENDSIHVERQYGDEQRYHFEKHRVLQILVNLITNAKYALENAPDERQRILTLKVSQTHEQTTFEITDNGIGIAPSERDKIFVFGFTTREGGNGIGLHSAAAEAQAMGGNLTAHSEGPGFGATFLLTLPNKRQQRPVAAA